MASEKLREKEVQNHKKEVSVIVNFMPRPHIVFVQTCCNENQKEKYWLHFSNYSVKLNPNSMTENDKTVYAA